MTIRAKKFTPSVLLSAPRRGAAIPNSDGTQILYSISTYSFESHEKKTEIRLLNSKDQHTSLVSDVKGVGPVAWLDDKTVVLLVNGDQGHTNVLVGNPTDWKTSYTAGSIDGPVGDLKVKRLDKSTYAVAVSASANPDGSLYNPESALKRFTSGRVYSSLFVRHWDTYVVPQRNTIFYGSLTLDDKSSKYTLSKLDNVLAGTGLESPIPPFGGTDHFDVGDESVIFAAKDPDMNPASNTKCNLYLVKILDWTHTKLSPRVAPEQVAVSGSFQGAISSPVFSPDGKSAAFLQMRQNGYESDKNHLIIIPDLSKPSICTTLLNSAGGDLGWDRSPSSITWSADGSTLFLTAEDQGRIVLFKTPAKPSSAIHPLALTRSEGSVTSVSALATGNLILSFTNLVDNSAYYFLQPELASPRAQLLSSYAKHGSLYGLSRKQVDELWWPGAAENTRVHAWVVKPSTFDPKQRYPLAYLVHGGPQGAWEDAWSTRWNPAVYAEQGYVVICPNPTGSTGYGQAFTDAIQKSWGGLPYQDLVLGFDFIEKNVTYVDTERAVALGASYGGYMMNWIQGQPLGRKFKALVTHDGVYSIASQQASEELYFPEHEFGGKWWNNQEEWLRYDPAKYTQNWSTPHLIIHSDKDYRLTVAEGLAAFNVLQERGVPSKYLTFPDENHWVLNPENSLLWHALVLEWINSFVGLPKPSETDPQLADVLKEAAVPEWGSVQN
jgi:dipeptidyl aminopeptidase/acylaminoacyl peptidase